MATTAPSPTDRPHRAAKRYIYAWGDGTAEGNGGMKDLLGGKGAGLAEMTIAGLPTPPGFTITTEACNDYFANGKQLTDAFLQGGSTMIRCRWHNYVFRLNDGKAVNCPGYKLKVFEVKREGASLVARAVG